MHFIVESQSELSDFEGRIRALNEELRRRKTEADKLKRERKKKKRDQMKNKEETLKKQIEVSIDVQGLYLLIIYNTEFILTNMLFIALSKSFSVFLSTKNK